jgi:hypothetical protein
MGATLQGLDFGAAAAGAKQARVANRLRVSWSIPLRGLDSHITGLTGGSLRYTPGPPVWQPSATTYPAARALLDVTGGAVMVATCWLLGRETIG